MIGTDANETLIGTAEDDTIIGNGGNDRIYGEDGDDNLQGNEDYNWLFGGKGDDVLEGGGSSGTTSYLLGGDGDDTYMIHASDGNQFLTYNGETATSGSNDRVVFADLGIADLDFGYADYGSYDVYTATWRDGDDRGTVYLANLGANIESYEFADGNTYNSLAIGTSAGETITGTEGDDLIVAHGGSDRIFGGEGDDDLYGGGNKDWLFGGAGDDLLDAGGRNRETSYLHGGDGNDTYVVRAAEGNKFLVAGAETATSGDADQLVFEDLTAQDLKLSEIGAGSDSMQLLHWNTGGDRGTVYINDDTVFIEAYRFADGRVVENIMIDSAPVMTGTDMSEWLCNSGRDDALITGGGGDDILTGGRGDDLFSFTSGDGDDFITDFDLKDDQIAFTDADIGFDDLNITETSDGGAIIAYGPNGDTIELAGVDPEAIGLTHFRFNYTDSDSVYLGG